MKTKKQPTRNGKVPRYELTWRNKWLTASAESIQDMRTAMLDAMNDLETLEALVAKKRVTVSFEGADDDYIEFFTTDPKIAREFGFLPHNLPRNVIARWRKEDWDDATMTASHYDYADLETGKPIELTEEEAGLYYWGQNITGGSQAGRLPARDARRAKRNADSPQPAGRRKR